MTAAPYYRTRPSPTHPGRWLVVHTVPGTHVESIDDDCPTLASAEKAAAWREAERAGPAWWGGPTMAAGQA